MAAHFAAVDAAADRAGVEDVTWSWCDDPDCGPPGGAEGWLALLPAPLIDEYHEATADRTGPEALPAGFWDRAVAHGAGFASGGVADRLPPGAVLAGLANDAWQDGLGRLDDDELVGVLRAARRLASWSAALELSAVSDLLRRRWDQEARGETGAAEHASDEIAAALTLTGRAADLLADLAQAMGRLPATLAALAAGDIDLPRARVIAEETGGLGHEHAAAVEQVIVAGATSQTTGQLRAATRRAVIAADPAAARTRKERAQREARVERWDEPAGTGALAGRDLPPASVLAADHHLTAVARELQAAGVAGTIDALRAQVFLALLSGQAPGASLQSAGLAPAEHGDCAPALTGSGIASGTGRGTGGGTGTGSVPPGLRGGPGVPVPVGHGQATAQTGHTASGGTGSGVAGTVLAGSRLAGSGLAGPGLAGPGLAGMVNLTMPVATWLGLSLAPGEAAGYGPLDAADSRTLAGLLARHPRTRWCLTLTDASGRPIAHGCTPSGTGPHHPGPGPRPSGPIPPRSTPPPSTPPGTPPRKPRRSGPAAGGPRSQGPASGGPSPPGSGPRALTWLDQLTIATLATGQCAHQRESSVYRPPPHLAHLIQVRQRTCSFPGCRRPAARCDLDHTIPFDQGGRTCECDLAPLCRRHHRAKQTRGWRLEQPEPGVLVWTMPSGRTYTTGPTAYPG